MMFSPFSVFLMNREYLKFMKIERLIGIITTLQQKGKVTAPYLAEKFEVSRRTINRDIEEICRAGIPIVTTQGVDGGIEIMEGYNLNTTVFTESELQEIFVGLKTLDSVSKTNKYTRLEEKISGKKNVISIANDMMIDLASFYKDSLSEKIELLRKAIAEKKFVAFHYYYNKGEADKYIEPYLVVFKWSDWYVFGYCRERQDFRLYKLGRLWNLSLCEECFAAREVPEEKLRFGQHMTDDKIITAVYEESEKYRLVEEYGPDSFQVLEDGKLYTEWGYTTYEEAVHWFLSFGSKVEVLEPEDFRELFLEEVRKLYGQYRKP